jgi:myosin protein heavy chain
MAAELDDATHELDSHRAKVLDLEKKQRNFDKILSEEKLNANRISVERDTAEREARDKETKLLNRELDATLARMEDSERNQKQLQNELDDLVNSQVHNKPHAQQLTFRT